MLDTNELNSNDYRILESILDPTNRDKGTTKGCGTTKKQIVAKTGLSTVKVHNTIKKLIELKLIDYGVKRVRANAFYITEKGFNQITEIHKNILSRSGKK